MADYLVYRVWKFVKDRGPIGRQPIADEFGIQLHYVSQMATKLRRDGHLVVTRKGNNAIYAATDVAPRRGVYQDSPPKSIRAKTGGLSWAQKAWRILRDAGRPMRGDEVEAALGIHRKCRYGLLNNMVKSGHAAKHGPVGWNRTFTAVGDVMPPDLRGTGKSLANLKWATHRKGYRKTLDGDVLPLTRVPTRRTFLLDKYFGLGSTRVDSGDDIVCNLPAQVRPEETQAA